MFYVFIVIAYLLGSISPSIIQGRLAGVDIKKEGSGNAGTTNTLRVLGKKAALITLIIDICKAVLAVFLGSTQGDLCSYICAVAVFAGHIWPVYFGFKGGKGVATAFGMLIGLVPALVGVAFALFAAVFACSNYISLGSISAAAFLMVAVWFPILGTEGRANLPQCVLVSAIAAFVIFKHRANIGRLLSGTESKIYLFKKT